MKILLTNYGSGLNLGDASILQVILKQLYCSGPRNSEIFVLTNDWRSHKRNVPEEIDRRTHFVCNPLSSIKHASLDIVSRIPSFPHVFKKADAIIVGSGDVLSNAYGRQSLLVQIATQHLALLFQKPLAFFGHTIGPFNLRSHVEKICIELLKREIEYASLVVVRDYYSINTLREIECNVSPPVECDPAFLLKPSNQSSVRQILESTFGVVPKKLAGINVSALIPKYLSRDGTQVRDLKKRYFDLLAESVDLLIEEYGFHVVLIPHVHGPTFDDRVACSKVFAKVKKKHKAAVLNIRNPNMVKGIIGNTDFLLSGRMHCLIHALSQGIPSIGIDYNRKTLSLLGMLGVDYCAIPLERLSEETLFGSIEQVLDNYSHMTYVFEKIKERAVFSAQRGLDRLTTWLCYL